MERTIIQGIKRLRVLTPYDYDNMDELVQDLSTALEESSCSRLASLKGRKGRTWKRRPKTSSNLVALSNSLPKSSAVSEDSESSLDDRARFKMELLANCSHPPSDSDEVPFSRQHHFSSWRHCSINLVESDSVNENFLPSRPQRRKRKFKRMAVDPQPSPTSSCVADATIFASPSQITRRVKSIRALKNKVRMCKISDIENVCGSVNSASRDKDSLSFCGKRKRSMRERSLEYGGSEEREECLMQTANLLVSPLCVGNNNGIAMDCDESSKTPIEGSSSLSSSESDGGILTNDEGREADDEHSDFFHEPGPVCGIPGVIPWWDEAAKLEDSGEPLDVEFQAILMGSFQHMSEATKQAYNANINWSNSWTQREIRAGRRRLRNHPSIGLTASVNESIVKSVHSSSPPEWSLVTPRIADVSLSQATVGDIKRRRRTPPSGPLVQGGVGDKNEPIPEFNVGSRILRKMGWEPGTGLGPQGQGICTPIVASANAKREGLGYNSQSMSLVKVLPTPPPPPPPSPQPGPAIPLEDSDTTSKLSFSDANTPLGMLPTDDSRDQW